MFRLVYVRLIALMSATILVLLGATLVSADVVFRHHLQYDSIRDLKRQAQEAVAAVRIIQSHTVKPFQKAVATASLSDDDKSNTFFLVDGAGHPSFFVSHAMPLTEGQLRADGRMDQVITLTSHGHAYRLYTTAFRSAEGRGTVYAATIIDSEARILREITTVLWWAGGFGGLALVLLTLGLAHYALKPTRQTWQSQQEMLLALSHELKTPLATLAAISRSAFTSAEGQSAEQTMLAETQRASGLVDEILYLAKLQSVNEQALEPIDASDVTEDTVQRFHLLAAEKDMTFAGTADVGIYVMSTMEQWAHLVSILCKNATQHGKQGTTIRWSLTATHNTVSLVVENEVSSSTSAKADARPSGIGLRIARQLVRRMRGQFIQTVPGGSVRSVVIVPRCNR